MTPRPYYWEHGRTNEWDLKSYLKLGRRVEDQNNTSINSTSFTVYLQHKKLTLLHI